MTMTQDSYLETLVQYYDEEIEGEAYFETLANLTADPTQKEALSLLAQVEHHAAKGVAPLLVKHSLTPGDAAALRASGHKDAAGSWAGWDELLDDMDSTYSGYLDDFRALEALGPSEDQPILAFLSEHEVAAIAFLEKARSDLNAAMTPLRNYLASPAPVAR
ncbi:MAG: hypothetical protein HRU31_16090 [Rhodobacteraceae bacterium]|nr:hypothetical protein [Paracoccaceae bacterium]